MRNILRPYIQKDIDIDIKYKISLTGSRAQPNLETRVLNVNKLEITSTYL